MNIRSRLQALEQQGQSAETLLFRVADDSPAKIYAGGRRFDAQASETAEQLTARVRAFLGLAPRTSPVVDANDLDLFQL